MTPTEYAKVKEVFARATQLNADQREAFLQQECGADSTTYREVKSLLSHHQDKSILKPEEPRVSSIEVATPSRIDPFLVLSDVWEENQHVLRRRLVIIAVLMAILSAVSMLRLPTNDDREWGYGVRILAIVVSLTLAWWLHRSSKVSIRGLRIAELVVVGNICFLEVAVYIRWMRALAREEDVATAVSVNDWHYIAWAMVIFVYGVFMPNTWRRAASVLIPMATIPAVVAFVFNAFYPNVAAILGQSLLGQRFLTPYVAAGIAIYAAHTGHGARVVASTARQLAQYKLLRLIGEGGMGRVYEAEHLLLKRACAVKLILPERSSEVRMLRRFQREVRATARLTHPNTIEVYDYGETKDGVFFFAMELLPGMNLRDLVKVAGPLPAERAVHFLIDVCDALTEAHDANLIHRDIKPANIFASQRGGLYDFTKLLDFGVVREIKVDASMSITSKMVAGTPSFMSPEQATSPLSIDARSDLYSVGAVGYSLLAGRPPFVAPTPMQVMLDLVEQTPEPIVGSSSGRACRFGKRADALPRERPGPAVSKCEGAS